MGPGATYDCKLDLALTSEEEFGPFATAKASLDITAYDSFGWEHKVTYNIGVMLSGEWFDDVRSLAPGVGATRELRRPRSPAKQWINSRWPIFGRFF